MRQINFRNSSRVITALLAQHQPTTIEQPESLYDEDLQFSTFRSDDYRFYQHFPHKIEHQHGDQSYLNDSSFEQLKNEEESQGYDEVHEEKKQLSSYGSTNESATNMRGVTFRNSSLIIRRILEGEEAEKGCRKGRRNLNFRNSSVLLHRLLEYKQKQI